MVDSSPPLISPGLFVAKTGRWTKAEDEQLTQAVCELGGKQWLAISKKVPGRSPIQCHHHWNKMLKPGLVKGPWSSEEDEALQQWVVKEGPTKWTLCAAGVPGRSGKQCRDRWCNTIDPCIKKGDWQESEDKVIFRLYQQMGPKWTEMTKYLPGRTENSLKNRFYSTIRKVKAKSSVQVDAENRCLPSSELAVNLQVITLLQQMHTLEQLLSKVTQQIECLEESIETEEAQKREDEQAAQEVLL